MKRFPRLRPSGRCGFRKRSFAPDNRVRSLLGQLLRRDGLLADKGEIEKIGSCNVFVEPALVLPELHLFLDVSFVQVRAAIAIGLCDRQHRRRNTNFARNRIEISVVVRARDKITAIGTSVPNYGLAAADGCRVRLGHYPGLGDERRSRPVSLYPA